MPYSRRHTGQRESAMTMFAFYVKAVCRLRRSTMHDRDFSSRVLLLIAIALPIAGCTNSQVDQLVVTPNAVSMPVGDTAQLTATGIYGHGSNHPTTTQDLTDQVTWYYDLCRRRHRQSYRVGYRNRSRQHPNHGQHPWLHGDAHRLLANYSSRQARAERFGRWRGCFPGHHPHIAVCRHTWRNSPVSRDRNHFFRLYRQLDRRGLLEFKQPADCDHRRKHRLATAVGPGTSTITALYSTDGNALTGTATFTVLGGTTEEYTAVNIVPGSQAVSASGQTGQFIALATSGTTGLEQDVTNSPQLTWLSSIPSVATVTSGLASGNGIATGVSLGTSTITAELKNPDGSLVTNSSSVQVTTHARAGASAFAPDRSRPQSRSATCWIPGNSWPSEPIQPLRRSGTSPTRCSGSPQRPASSPSTPTARAAQAEAQTQEL